MGRNINMIKMFGDFTITCPQCGYKEKASETILDDVDVDGTDFNPANGVWVIKRWSCSKCEYEYDLTIQVKAKQVDEDTINFICLEQLMKKYELEIADEAFQAFKKHIEETNPGKTITDKMVMPIIIIGTFARCEIPEGCREFKITEI